MHRALTLLCLLGPVACHGQFGQRTTQEETDLKNFAEARTRAATYYEGGDFERAAAQYKEALNFRKDHVATRMGYAYSLMFVDKVSSLLEAETQFTEEIGELRDPKEEVKRVFGLGSAERKLAAHYDRRSRLRSNRGQVKGAAEDAAKAREYAQAGIKHFERVIELDQVLARDQQVSALRVSASLTPDAHVAMAHCHIIMLEPNPNFDPQKHDEIERHLTLAEQNLEVFAQTAKNARTFWQQRRERLLVTDPLKDNRPGARTTDPVEVKRYESRIKSTIEQEVAARKALTRTLFYLNRFERGIEEATRILELSPREDDVLAMRGRAYVWLSPPDLDAAIRDLKEYRARKVADNRLTDELVRLNREIRDLEVRQKQQEQDS